MGLDWNDIRLLVEVHRTGSFAAAADTLGISKPTVSRRVTALEQMAGALLFRRQPSGAELTMAGEQLLQRAMSIETEIQSFERSLRGIGLAGNRVVTLQTSEGVANFLLAPLISKQNLGPLGRAAHRIGVHLPLVRILQAASLESADIRIVWAAPEHGPAGRSTDKVRKLASIRFVPYAAATPTADMAPPPDRFDDLTRHKLITLSDYQWFQTDLSLGHWNHLLDRADAGVIPAAWTSMMGHLTAQGAGIALLPTYTTQYTDLIRPLDVASPTMTADLWIVAREDDLRDPAVRRCYSALIKIFSACEW